MLRLAAQRRVPLLAGTDELPAGSLAEEVAALRAHGLTPAEALAAASTGARAFLGLPGLAPGAPADVAAFESDPRADLADLARPAAVLFGGG